MFVGLLKNWDLVINLRRLYAHTPVLLKIAAICLLALVKSNDSLELFKGLYLAQFELLLALRRPRWLWLHEEVDIAADLKFILSANLEFLHFLIFIHYLDVLFFVLGGEQHEWQLVLLVGVNRVKVLQFLVLVLKDQFLVANVVLQLIRKVLFFLHNAVFRVLSRLFFQLNLLLQII